MSTPIVIGGISCYELWRSGRPESARERFSANKIGAVRVLRCAWSDRLALTFALRGGASSTGGVVTLYPPAKYPDVQSALCNGVEIEGEGKAGQAGTSSLISYDFAILTVNYETPDFVATDPNGNGQLFLSEMMDYNAEFITIPTASFIWTSDNKPLAPDAVPGKIMGMAEYALTAHHHPNPPWAAIQSNVGKVNNGTFAPLLAFGGRSFADGQLLFLGEHDSREFLLGQDGTIVATVYNVTYKWAYRTEKWNTAFRPETGQFEFFQTPAGNQLYRTGDFLTLF